MTRRKKTDYEGGEQVVVAQWLDLHRVKWFHTPNGGARNAVTGSILKRQGVKPGVPDIVIIDRPPADPLSVGVVIELKAPLELCPRARPSKEQMAWLRDFADRGWLAKVCHGAVDAISWLKKLGYESMQ